LKKREGEISEGKIPGVYFDRIRFNDLCDDFLADYRVNGKKSLVRAERSANHLKTSFDGAKVTNITSPRINAYIQKRIDEGAENATVNRELAALKRIFNLAARQTPQKVDRIPYIPMLKENNVRKGFFEHGDFLALREALPDYMKGLVTFAYKTGWRVSEIEGLPGHRSTLPMGLSGLRRVKRRTMKAGRSILTKNCRKSFNGKRTRGRNERRSFPMFSQPNRAAVP
jgi:site-specific recombinase XerD